MPKKFFFGLFLSFMKKKKKRQRSGVRISVFKGSGVELSAVVKIAVVPVSAPLISTLPPAISSPVVTEPATIVCNFRVPSSVPPVTSAICA